MSLLEVRDEDNTLSLSLLARAFNQTTRTQPPNETSGFARCKNISLNCDGEPHRSLGSRLHLQDFCDSHRLRSCFIGGIAVQRSMTRWSMFASGWRLELAITIGEASATYRVTDVGFRYAGVLGL